MIFWSGLNLSWCMGLILCHIRRQYLSLVYPAASSSLLNANDGNMAKWGEEVFHFVWCWPSSCFLWIYEYKASLTRWKCFCGVFVQIDFSACSLWFNRRFGSVREPVVSYVYSGKNCWFIWNVCYAFTGKDKSPCFIPSRLDCSLAAIVLAKELLSAIMCNERLLFYVNCLRDQSFW